MTCGMQSSINQSLVMGDRFETRASLQFLGSWVDNSVCTVDLRNNNQQLVRQSTMRHDLYSCIDFDQLTHMSQSKLSYQNELTHT